MLTRRWRAAGAAGLACLVLCACVLLRDLIGTGYIDAADEVGAGLTATWPFHGARAAVTPKVAIDHVLVDNRIGVRDFAAHAVPRTDHRAIVATLVLPPKGLPPG
jgi:hypothetical protein